MSGVIGENLDKEGQVKSSCVGLTLLASLQAQAGTSWGALNRNSCNVLS